MSYYREITHNNTSSISLKTDGVVSSLSDITAAFISKQDVKKSSRETYARELYQFFRWVDSTSRTMNCLTREDILAYKSDLLEKGLSNLTVGNYIVTIRKFYEWAESMKLYPNISKGVKVPYKKQAFKKQHLTEAKINELVSLAEDNRSIRDFAIINLMLRTGLRCVEVSRADISDIEFRQDRRILKVWGKGKDSKDDFVVLTEKAWKPIEAYLKTRKNARKHEPLFASESRQNKGKRISTRTISKLCKDALREIGLDGREFSAHSLRHTTAVLILKYGGSITDVQDVLRHSSPATSEIYTESIKEEMRIQSPSEKIIDKAF